MSEIGTDQSAAAAEQVKPWQFQRGTSGNPAGRPPKTRAMRELERVTRQQAAAVLERLAGPALKVLQRALAGKDQALAVKAAVDILDRTQGRATQRIEGHIGGIEPARRLSSEEIAAAARLFLARQAAAQAADVLEAGQQPHVLPAHVVEPEPAQAVAAQQLPGIMIDPEDMRSLR